MWFSSSHRIENIEESPKVSGRSKYALSGVYTIENFTANANQHEYPFVIIGSLCGIEWYIQLCPVFNTPSIWATISHGYSRNRVKLNTSGYFNFVNENRSIKYENEDHSEIFNGDLLSEAIAIKDVLDEKNGWLINDELSIEYGFHVHGTKEDDDVWKFNFEGKLFNCKEKEMIILRHSKPDDSGFFGFNKKFLSYQTNYFDGPPDAEIVIPDDMNPKFVNECFQIAHGVHIQLTDSSRVLPMLEISAHYKLSNVIKYLEKQIFQQFDSSETIQFWISNAIQFDLNHLFSQLMRREDSPEILEVIKTETSEMSGRIMKMLVAKYLYNRSK